MADIESFQTENQQSRRTEQQRQQSKNRQVARANEISVQRISPANWREQGGGAAAARLSFSWSRIAGMTGGRLEEFGVCN